MIRESSKNLLSAGRFPTVSLAEGEGLNPCDRAAVVGYANFGVPGAAPAGCFGVVRRRSRGDFRELFFPSAPTNCDLSIGDGKKRKKPPRGVGSRLRGPRRPAAAGPGPAGPGLISPQPPPETPEHPRGAGRRWDAGRFLLPERPRFFLLLRFCWFTFPQIRPRKETFRR